MDSTDAELFEDDFDDFLEVISRPRRRRKTRTRVDYITELDEIDFRARFRFSKAGAFYIHGLIEKRIETKTTRNAAIDSMTRLLLTLRYFATGSFLMAAGDFVGVSEASASRIVFQVAKEIALLRPLFVQIPSDLGTLKKDFFQIAKLPNAIGAIDCTHVQIKNPGGQNSEIYRNRKSKFSINVQVICNANLEIMDVVARWPGSCHDQTIFNNSLFQNKLYRGNYGNSVILADSGYENNRFVLTPLLSPSTPAENLYNESQIRSRNVVERTFGVWKSRFPVLQKTISISLVRVQPVIVACAVLHNIACLLREEPFLHDDSTEPMPLLEPHYNNAPNYTMRNRYITYFNSLLQ